LTVPAALSVVTVSYNCRADILELLADLATASASLPLEVHVVDNASTDGTVDAIREQHPWVDLEALDSNIGFARANNRALYRASGEYIVCLNPDTRVDTQALDASTTALAKGSDIGILTPRVVDEAGRFDRRCMRGFPTVWSLTCHVSRLDRVLPTRASRRYTMGWLPDDQPADVEAVSGAVMFARRDALLEVGGFDERFFMYGEDIDLCLRVGDAGWRVRYWPGASIVHLAGRSGLSPDARRAWARSIGTLHRIHRPGMRGRIAGTLCDAGGMALRATGTIRVLRRMAVR
jgi:GT2 family glycosyltransferase